MLDSLVVWLTYRYSETEFAGTFFRVIERYLHWNEQSKTLGWIRKICGVLLVVGAAYLLRW